jgi:hypothetical protein
MASTGFSIVLEMEVSEIGPTTSTKEAARTDPADGVRQSELNEERIANELRLKLGIRVSPRAVGNTSSQSR